LAVWNGTSWSALLEGVDDTVHAIEVSGGNLYVAGRFGQAGSGQAKHIARWDGGQWNALGEGTSDIVYAVALSGPTGDVYIGGAFT
jgi:hypothetical protein